MSPTFPTAAAPALILEGCAYTVLQTLPANSIDCIITSPPYWGLRDYGIAPTDWPACSYAPMPGLPPIEVPAETSCLGLEPTLHAFLAHITLIFAECRRVLKPTGSCWVNMGDSYNNSDKWGGGHTNTSKHTVADDGSVPSFAVRERKGNPDGLKPKDLIGQPWRVAFALQASGWYLRQDNIWHKPNPMPESIRDRATKSHEYIFHLTKQERYYFDLAAWAEPASEGTHARLSQNVQAQIGSERAHAGGKTNGNMKAVIGRQTAPKALTTPDGMTKNNASMDASLSIMPLTRNKRSVWTVPTCAYSEAHYATYPPHFITPPMLATTSAKGCCSMCGKPWERITAKQEIPRVHRSAPKSKIIGNDSLSLIARKKGDYMNGPELAAWKSANPSTSHWQPTCMCSQSFTDPITIQPAIVLDPFGGSGTTAQVALEHGRHAILIERGPHNIALIHKRLTPTLASPVLPLA